jgi:hypothetical protein
MEVILNAHIYIALAVLVFVFFCGSVRAFIYGADREFENRAINYMSHPEVAGLLAVFVSLLHGRWVYFGEAEAAFWRQEDWIASILVFVINCWWFFLFARIYATRRKNPPDKAKRSLAYAVNVLVGLCLSTEKNPIIAFVNACFDGNLWAIASVVVAYLVYSTLRD